VKFGHDAKSRTATSVSHLYHQFWLYSPFENGLSANHGEISAGLSLAHFASNADGVFRRLGASFGLLGPGFGMHCSVSSKLGGGTGGEQGERTDNGSGENEPVGAHGPIRRLLGGIGGLPLGAKVGVAVILSCLAGWIGVFGYVGILDWRLACWRRAGRGLLMLLGLCLFCLPAAFWW